MRWKEEDPSEVIRVRQKPEEPKSNSSLGVGRNESEEMGNLPMSFDRAD